MNGKKAKALRRAERLHSPVPPTIDPQLEAHSVRVEKQRQDLSGTDTMLVTAATAVSALRQDPGQAQIIFTSSYERAVDLVHAILEAAEMHMTQIRLFPCQIVVAEELPDGRHVVRVMPPWANTAEDAMQKSRVLIMVPVNKRTPIVIGA